MITVTLSESVNVSVTVHYTATYTPQAAAQSIGSNQISGNLIFAPGELTQSFSLTLLPEWKANLPARIALKLDSVNSEIVSGQNSATLTIMQRFFLPLIQQN